jgi:hypothetical protein
VKELKHVEVQHRDAQMPAVLLWQGDIISADEASQTFKVHIINTGETLPSLPASRIRKRQRGSAAV